MVKIQFIENYKDDTNSDLVAKDAMAMNLGFKDKFFISGTAEGGIGISDGHILGTNLLQNAKWITSFINLKHQNIGFSESDNLTNTELLNTEIISHYEPYSSLATLNVTQLGEIDATNFNDTYASRINTTVKLSKQTQLLIKSNNVREELSRLNAVTSKFTIDDEPIIRNELTNQNVNYFNSESNIGIKHKSKKSIFKSELYFKSLSHKYEQNIDLNGSTNEQVTDETRQQFNVDIKYEKLISNNMPIILNAGYHYKPLNQNLINQGFNNLNQDFKTRENVYYANASLLKRQQDSSIIELHLKSKLSAIKQYLNSQTNVNTFSTDEQLMTNEVRFDWKKDSKTKDYAINSGFNIYAFNIDSDNSYSKFAPFINANLKIKNKKTTHNFGVESTTDWVLNNPFTPFDIFDSFNNSYRITSANDAVRNSQLSYNIFNTQNLNDKSFSVSLNHNSKSVLSNFNINSNNSSNTIEITNRDNYSLNFSTKYNTLLWKLFFFEFSFSPSFGNTYISDNNGAIKEVNSSIYLTELKFNRRFSKQLFIGSTTQFQYREFKSELSNNDLLTYGSKVYLTYEFGNFELKGDYNHIKIGDDNKTENFSSMYVTFTPKESNFKGYLQLFNLFNTESITTASSSNIGDFSSSFNLPQRRLTASVTYTF
ncbi:hypothetical protein H7F37_09015 [Winogradskyella sp. PAMC22761]|nr:hypothetical protein H7F37_09015 [Winogradskyella sp. PAMC22761]